VKRFQSITKKIQTNLSYFKFEGIFVSVFLLFILLLLIGNTLRTISNGQGNYATYLEEKLDLDILLDRNLSLSQELEYVNSEEYKALLLRDAQNLAKPEEQLFTTKYRPSFLSEDLQHLDLKSKRNFLDWWAKLIQ
jgi:hypothetical protein